MDNGLTLIESRAISTYLINKYKPDSPLYPQDPAKRAKVDAVLYFEATLFGPVLNVMVTLFLIQICVQQFFVVIQKTLFYQNETSNAEAIGNIEDKLNVLAKLLGNGPFLAGDQPTLADISLGTYLWRIENINIGIKIPVELHSWNERTTKAIPVLAEINQKAKEILDGYMKAKQEAMTNQANDYMRGNVLGE